MGLSAWLAARAVSGAHVLVAEAPGWWVTRAALERALAGRGWRIAMSPADADVLVVCGEPGRQLAAAFDRVWEQLPGPRARVTVRQDAEATTVLDDATSLLLHEQHQQMDAQTRPSVPAPAEPPADNHGGMDDSDTDMAPAGIPLASGGTDRDGLDMDVLHVPLGPVLPHWPAGLVLRCSLQGDVVAEAQVDVLEASAPPPQAMAAKGLLPAARRCDGAARLLAVAGWEDAAATARQIRDGLLTGRSPTQATDQLDRLQSRVCRSRSLRWLLRGLGRVDDTIQSEHGLPDALCGDVYDRLVAMLTRSRAELDREATEEAVPAAALAALPGLVTGLDLAAARLVVASVDLDTAAIRREAVRA